MNACERTGADAAEPTRSPIRLYLIGARGSGKTTIGRLVAAKLGLPFFDADDVLEAKERRAIREMFAVEGESWFRDQEELVLAQLAAGEHAVIATGGGAVIRTSNRERMRRGGWVVWLRAGADTLWRRLQNDPATPERRPNLAGGGKEEVVELLHERELHYKNCAHFEVSTDGRSPDAVACDIVAQCLTSSWTQACSS
jgi:shikimate kinase